MSESNKQTQAAPAQPRAGDKKGEASMQAAEPRSFEAGVERKGEAAGGTARSGAEAAQQTANAAADAVQSSTEGYQSLLGQGEALSQWTTRSLEKFAQANSALTSGFGDLSREWLSVPQILFQTNLNMLGALARCRSVPEVAAVQVDSYRETVGRLLESSRRLGVITERMCNEASHMVGPG